MEGSERLIEAFGELLGRMSDRRSSDERGGGED
jgi:hypothetical protein